MQKLRDSSEVKEAASLLGVLLQETTAEDAARTGFRGERIQRALKELCVRARLDAASLCDRHGLPLAVFEGTMPQETIAALTTVLGDALAKAAQIAGWAGATSIAVDVDYEAKLVLRRFLVDDVPYFLVVQCPQETDERSEVEISLEQISSILALPRIRPESGS